AAEVAATVPARVARPTALAVLPAHLPPAFPPRLLTLASALDTPDARAYLLTRLIAHLAPEQQSAVLTETLDAIAAINGDDARALALIALAQPRSEERRVGKEGRSRWSPDQ